MGDENKDGSEQPAEGTGTGTPAGTGSETTFTQDQVNQFIEDRLRQERENAPGRVLKTFGFASPDEARAAKAAVTELDDLKAKFAGRDQSLIGAVLEAKAVASGVKPGSTEMFLRLVDRNSVAIDDSGAVTGAEDAIKAVIGLPEAKGFLATSQERRTPASGAGGNPASGSDTKTTARGRWAAQVMGQRHYGRE